MCKYFCEIITIIYLSFILSLSILASYYFYIKNDTINYGIASIILSIIIFIIIINLIIKIIKYYCCPIYISPINEIKKPIVELKEIIITNKDFIEFFT